MMYNLPFYPHYYSRRYNYYNPNNFKPPVQKQKEEPVHKKVSTKKRATEDSVENIIEIFGIKLKSDDILLICLIFFLYKEGVKDEYLFISLILLLLS